MTVRASTVDGLKVRAPGKVNLALRVGRVRADGYHPLATVFQALSLFDDLGVRAAPPGSYSVRSAGEQAEIDNRRWKGQAGIDNHRCEGTRHAYDPGFRARPVLHDGGVRTRR